MEEVKGNALFTCFGLAPNSAFMEDKKGKWEQFSPVDSAQCDSAQQSAGLNKKRGKFGVHVFVNKQDFRGLGRFFQGCHDGRDAM